MEQIGIPDQGLPFLWQKVNRLSASRFNFCVPRVFKQVVMLVRRFCRSQRRAYILRQYRWPLVRTGIVDERARLFPNVFQSHPYAAHEAQRTSTEMHQICMNMLLRPDGEVQRLKRKSAPAVELTQEGNDDRVGRNLADALVDRPGVRHTHTRDGPRFPCRPIKMRLERLPNVVSQSIKLRIGEFNDSKTIALHVRGDRLIVKAFFAVKHRLSQTLGNKQGSWQAHQTRVRLFTPAQVPAQFVHRAKLIGGFILGGGTGATAVAVRGIGPSLSAFGITNPLLDPMIELHNANGAIIDSNDDWRTNQALIEPTGLQPTNDAESALLFSNPGLGAYTAILRGKNGGTGVGVVEIYVF
jgi:hypothetical protein